MADELDNIVLVYLRRFDEKLDRVGEDVRELKGRMTAVAERLVVAGMSLSQIEWRLTGIERRLDRLNLRKAFR